MSDSSPSSPPHAARGAGRDDVPRLPLSVLQQTVQFLRDPIPLVERGRAECGDLFALRILGVGTWVFVCSPRGVEEMVRTPSDALVAGEITHRIFSGLFDRASLITLDGEPHLERRRLMLPCFQEQQVSLHLGRIERIAGRVVDAWPIGRPFALLPQLQEISFQVMIETVFGADAPEHARPLVRALRRVLVEVYTSTLLSVPPLQIDLGRFSPWGRLLRQHADLCAAVDAHIERRRREAGDLRERQDVLARLLVHQSEHPGALSDRAVREELLQLMAAGFETTAFVGCWAIECALSYPDAMARARAEVAAVVADAPFERAHLPRLNYLEALIHECIRHRMPSPFAGLRLVKRPVTLLGHRLPEGALVSMCLAGLGMRDDTFPEPRRFRPERFLERRPSVFEWNPFGSGTRQCIGKGLALAELKVILATIFTRARLRAVDADRRRERAGLFFVPRRGLRVTLDPPRSGD